MHRLWTTGLNGGAALTTVAELRILPARPENHTFVELPKIP
jgi:hypothetical protein